MDDMFKLLWQRYRGWSETSTRLKKRSSAWKRIVLVLTIVGTAFATLGPFAQAPMLKWLLPFIGAAALAVATYLGKQLLDTKHEERWTRARAAAEALKSEACKYLVQLPPYDAVDRITSLKTRMARLLDVVKGQQPIDITPEAAAEGLPTAPWTIADYKTKRLDDQIAWYRTKAKQHSDAMQVGRVLALALGVAAVVLSTVTGATTDTQTIWGAVLGIVTTVGASVGAYFQAGHFEAIALKYRETAVALENLKAEIDTAIANPADLVSTAEDNHAGGERRLADRSHRRARTIGSLRRIPVIGVESPLRSHHWRTLAKFLCPATAPPSLLLTEGLLVRVQPGEPLLKPLPINNLQDQPNRSIELPQRKSLIRKSVATKVSSAQQALVSGVRFPSNTDENGRSLDRQVEVKCV